MSIERYVRVIDGEECLSTEAVGILSGQTPGQIKDELARQGTAVHGRFVVPKSWRRGAKEMQAKYGTDNGAEVLARVLIERGEL
jgi:hypothetical protein